VCSRHSWNNHFILWLVENGIEVHTQIVVTPGVNDGPHLEKSVRDLADVYWSYCGHRQGVRSLTLEPGPERSRCRQAPGLDRKDG